MWKQVFAGLIVALIVGLFNPSWWGWIVSHFKSLGIFFLFSVAAPYSVILLAIVCVIFGGYWLASRERSLFGGTSSVALSSAAPAAPTLPEHESAIVAEVRPRSMLTDKSDIDRKWQESLSGAQHSVQILAGDNSWAGRDEKTIFDATQSGTTVKVLCHNPRDVPKLQQNIRILIASRAHVRYYPKDVGNHPYGLLVDPEQPDVATALQTKRTPVIKDGVPQGNYKYKVTLYAPHDDSIATLYALFCAIWKGGIPAVVLEPLDDSVNVPDMASQYLLHVHQYKTLKQSSVSFESVNINELYSSCTYVKQNRLNSLAAIVEQYAEQGITPFRPSKCWTCEKSSMLLPPIIERHDDKLVVVDGTLNRPGIPGDSIF